MKRLAIFLTALGGISLPSCHTSVPPAPQGQFMPILPAENAPKTRQYVFFIQMRMATLDVPVGALSGSEELWSYLDEQRTAPGQAASLARNGIRVGLGKKGSIEDVSAVIKRLTGAKMSEFTVTTSLNHPYPIVLQAAQPLQTIFITHADRTVSGADYPAGDNLLGLSFSFNEDDPSSILMTALPQIRSGTRKLTYVTNGTGGEWEYAPTMYSFNGLQFQARIRRGDFIVIGPGAQSRLSESPGSRFLVRTREGMQYESVLILFPELWAQEAGGS